MKWVVVPIVTTHRRQYFVHMTHTPAPLGSDTSAFSAGSHDRVDGSSMGAPQRGTNPVRAARRYLTRYAGFSGRSSRSEYWWVALLNVIVFFGGSVLMLVVQSATSDAPLRDDVSVGAGLIGTLLALWFVGTFIPGLALGVRRLHDADLSGWFILLNLIPFFGPLVVLVLTLLSPNPAGARFDR